MMHAPLIDRSGADLQCLPPRTRLSLPSSQRQVENLTCRRSSPCRRRAGDGTRSACTSTSMLASSPLEAIKGSQLVVRDGVAWRLPPALQPLVVVRVTAWNTSTNWSSSSGSKTATEKCVSSAAFCSISFTGGVALRGNRRQMRRSRAFAFARAAASYVHACARSLVQRSRPYACAASLVCAVRNWEEHVHAEGLLRAAQAQAGRRRSRR
jgi:hypothetical protein